MMGAIILDADLKSALAAIRSLGREKVAIEAGAVRSSGMGLHSRYVAGSFVYPDPKINRAGFVVTVKAVAQRLRHKTGAAPLVYCFSDATFLALVEVIDQLDGLVVLPLSRKADIDIAFDKNKTAALAERLGIRVIKSRTLAEAETMNYPVVVKPSQSVSWQGERAYSGTAEFVFDHDMLQDRYQSIKMQSGSEPLIQEVMYGEEYGVEMLCQHGEVLATFTHARVRSLSPTGGAAVVKETAPMFTATETMKSQSHALAKALNWTGPIMVEWKLDQRTSIPHLMEINGRFWGSLPLAVKAGVDFPWLYYQLGQGAAVKISETFSPLPVRTRHFWGDVRWLSKVLFSRSSLRSIFYPTRWWALKMFLLEPFRSKSDVGNWRDPLPSVFEFFDIVRKSL